MSIITLIIGFILGIFFQEIFKEIKKQNLSSFEIIPQKIKEDLVPRHRIFWKNATEHYFVRFPQILEYGWKKGLLKIGSYYIWVFKKYAYFFNPFVPRKIKAILYKDSLDYDTKDYHSLKAFYLKRNTNKFYKTLTLGV